MLYEKEKTPVKAPRPFSMVTELEQYFQRNKKSANLLVCDKDFFKNVITPKEQRGDIVFEKIDFVMFSNDFGFTTRLKVVIAENIKGFKLLTVS